MARLIQESGGERREKKIAGTITIGRSASADFHVDDKTLSREHTQVYAQHGRYFVKDLESKNGTFLNGQLIRQPEPLKHGDRVKVGPAVFLVAFDPGDVAAAPAPKPPTHVPAAAPAPAPAHAPAPRPRTHAAGERLVGVHPLVKFVHTIILGAVVVVGAFVSKFIFLMILDRIPK